MQLYNTMSRRIEPFMPANEEMVTVYACGITPYDTTHLGHAFTYTAIDILIRYLEAQGYTVNYVQNVTDIDDDILKKAEEVGEDWRALGNRWTSHFIQDMQTLNVRSPDHFPQATDVIPQIVATIEQLLKAGVAYEARGTVYYEIESWPAYGKLSHLSRREMLPVANERGNNPDDSHKRNKLDFVLWQAKAPGEPAWDSPWGSGRPGWHIECSTMASHLLGDTIDIHAGGADLVFPHHESEIAQIEPITKNDPFAQVWFHTAMVCHENEKMSKSLGNLVMVRDLLKNWSPDTVRLYLGNHHYRHSWSHHTDEILKAEQLAQKLKLAVAVKGGDQNALNPVPIRASFAEALNDDLNTPAAILAMETLAEEILVARRVERQIVVAQETLRDMGRIFGLRLDAKQSESRVRNGWGKYLGRFDPTVIEMDEKGLTRQQRPKNRINEENIVDEVAWESFPASDPPAWTGTRN